MKHDPPKALYVHVPFCLSKCSYCDFYSIVISPRAVRRYLAALRSELKLTEGDRADRLATVYVGGGTPTALTVDDLAGLLSLLRDEVDVAPTAEFTVEANPGTLTSEKLRVLANHGVNRLSIGAQSFDDRLLDVLTRRHTRRDVMDVLRAAKDAGFSNLSLDLMFGIPTQSVADWSRDIDAVLAADVPHVSAYALTYAEGTPLAKAAAAGEIQRVGEEEELRMYELVIDTLTARGYEHYEVSNFARAGSQCAHNEVYWANASYLGLGPSAASYVAGERRRNADTLEGYVSELDAGELPVALRERLTPEKRAREKAVMNLRRTRGIDFGEFRRHTGFDAQALFATEFEQLAGDGLVTVGSRSVRLTRRGLMVADSVLSELV